MNVMQNFEYFNDNETDSQTKPPAIIIMHENTKDQLSSCTNNVTASRLTTNYSNEVMSNLLQKKTNYIKQTDI